MDIYGNIRDEKHRLEMPVMFSFAELIVTNTPVSAEIYRNKIRIGFCPTREYIIQLNSQHESHWIPVQELVKIYKFEF